MLRRRDHNQDIEVFKEYMNEHPDSSRAAFNLGKALKEKGDSQSAMRYFKKCLQLLSRDREISDFSRNYLKNNAPKMMDELKTR